jgi:hypothetical protein
MSDKIYNIFCSESNVYLMKVTHLDKDTVSFDWTRNKKEALSLTDSEAFELALDFNEGKLPLREYYIIRKK